MIFSGNAFCVQSTIALFWKNLVQEVHESQKVSSYSCAGRPQSMPICSYSSSNLRIKCVWKYSARKDHSQQV